MMQANIIGPIAKYALFLCAASAAVHAQSVKFVDASATGLTADGSSWCSAFTNLQDALAVAVSGDTIRVARGTYPPDQGAGQTPGDRLSTFQLKNGVSILGGYAGCGAVDENLRDVILFETILTGELAAPGSFDNAYNVVRGSGTDSTAVLDGFTITAGRADGPPTANNTGAALSNRPAGSPTIISCTFRGNLGGAAVMNEDSTPKFTDCKFIDNGDGTRQAAGMFNLRSATVLERCSFSGNRGTVGGAMYNSGAAPTLTNCTFDNNFASFLGGAMYNIGSIPHVTSCTFTANTTSNSGGAIYNKGSSPIIVDCAFSGNSAGENGGAVYFKSVQNSIRLSTLTNCTFDGNSAAANGGALYNTDGSAAAVSDCTFTDNVAEIGGAVYNVESAPSFRRCAFVGNRANSFGGGTYSNSNSPAVFANCSFLGNTAVTAGGGGACNNQGSDGLFVNCLFSGNTAVHGAGFGNRNDSNPILANCTFSRNVATDSVGGFYNNAASPTLINCIFWGNVDPSGTGQDAQVHHTGLGAITVSHSDIEGWTGSFGGAGNRGDNPLLVDADGPDDLVGTLDDDLRLISGSPAINGGDNTQLPSDAADLDDDGDTTEPTPLDMGENARIFEAVVDMGAFESHSLQPPQCPPGTFSATGMEPCFPCPFGTSQPDPGQTSCVGSCATDANCDDGILCTLDSCSQGVCNNVPDDSLCATGFFCNQQRCDPAAGCVAAGACLPQPGNPCADPAICDENTDTCGGCVSPVVAAVGSRYLSITPLDQTGAPVALLITGDCGDANTTCVNKYVQSNCLGGQRDGLSCASDADCPKTCATPPNTGQLCFSSADCAGGACEGFCDAGTLGDASVFLTAAQWGAVSVRGIAIRPATSYAVYTLCDFGASPIQSAAAHATTYAWADTDGDGDVNVIDITTSVDGVKGLFSQFVTFEGTNVWPCDPGTRVDVFDITATVDAVKGLPLPCSPVCP